MWLKAGKQLKDLGFGHVFGPSQKEHTVIPPWITQFNQQSLAFSIKNFTEEENVTSLLINHPKLLLRKKQELWPDGRTSYRFKNALRRRVTIVGKTAFNMKKETHLVERQVFVGSESNYKETLEEED